MITITMDNLSGFYVFSTYIPTFLMVVITYSTFYFDIDDFNDRIMVWKKIIWSPFLSSVGKLFQVSLTALLVLATLFTQVTQTTPKTAYLKLLDYWFVSCIFIDFIIVLVHVTINVVKLKEENEESSYSNVLSYKKPFVAKEKYEKSKKYNRWAIIACPIIVLLFVFVYVIISNAFVL